MYEQWNQSKEFDKCVRDYHDACARQPSGKNLEDAKEILEIMKPYIANKLKEKGLFENTRFEHRGSTYEGVKVAKSANDDDLEFDVMYVIKGGTDLQATDLGTDGYAYLKLKMGKEPRKVFKKTTTGDCISACETRNQFYGQIIKCDFSELDCSVIGNGKYKKNEISFQTRYHGPAVKIDVMRNREKFFSVDLAPHYDLTGQGTMYVPKAPKKRLDDVRWFRSFSLQEKMKFDGLDKDNGCRKMVLRTLKVFVKSQAELACLTSQHLKTALLMAVEAQPSWKQHEFGERFMDVLKILEDALEKKILPHYFLKDVNLFENFEDGTMECMKCRLSKLGRNSRVMTELLNQAVNQMQQVA